MGVLVLPVLFGGRSASAASTTVVISQFQVLGGGTDHHADEFVELHNVGTSSVDLDGMRLVYRSAAGTTDVNLRDWSVSTLIPPGGYYLLGHAQGYDGPAADATFGAPADNGVLSMSGGGLALRQGANNTARSSTPSATGARRTRSWRPPGQWPRLPTRHELAAAMDVLTRTTTPPTSAQ